MANDRDVGAFDARAGSYEQGWLGRLHHEIADRTADLALAVHPEPRAVLDVGCGTGYRLRRRADLSPSTPRLVGVDPAPSMVAAAISAGPDRRLSFSAGVVEHLPYPNPAFDLVVSTTSFDHWEDQLAGLGECARVLGAGGHLVLADQFSLWLAPTLLIGQRGKARTKCRATARLRGAGFTSVVWHDLYAAIIRAATATI